MNRVCIRVESDFIERRMSEVWGIHHFFCYSHVNACTSLS